jgi:hypothetical protein
MSSKFNPPTLRFKLFETTCVWAHLIVQIKSNIMPTNIGGLLYKHLPDKYKRG